MKRLLPWLVLGPITGPLAAWLERAVARRNWLLAAVLVLAIAETWILLPAIVLSLGLYDLDPS